VYVLQALKYLYFIAISYSVFISNKGSSCSWSYDSWIYNNLYNQCIR